MAVKWYDDIKRCPICGGACQKLGSVYLEFRCQNEECEAIVRFPSEAKLTPEEQVERFNRRTGGNDDV